jgi:triacylglycerol lipase
VESKSRQIMEALQRCLLTAMNAVLRLFARPLSLFACALAALLPVSAMAGSTYAQTQYPIVLVHGVMGFSDIIGVDYFYQIPSALRSNGATVYVASVSSVNDNDVRGEQLLKQLQQWAAIGGHQKFNLVAHSQGGPTARYVAGVAPSLVASVSSVSSPHDLTGPGGRDVALAYLVNSTKLANFLGSVIGWMSGSPDLPQDSGALQAWAKDTPSFNARFPAGQPTTYCGQGAEKANGIYFYSVAGNKPKTNVFDLTDTVMTVESGIATDGVVPVCGAHWGKVLRDNYPWNHLDEMNHLMGLVGFAAPDPVAFYTQQANRLKLLGL